MNGGLKAHNIGHKMATHLTEMYLDGNILENRV
jgi:hypothetical protein